MRIPSGKTDQSIYFVAVDAADLKTRETGLSGFTVQRSRNGASEVAYTTPTVAEIDATNMPGVYALLVDEDTTIASTSDSEEYCVHITHASMAPVTRTIELYRRDTTSGQTIDVAFGGVEVGSFQAGAITAAAIATGAIDADALAADAGTEIGTAVWATAARTLTALDEDSTTIDLDATIAAAAPTAAAIAEAVAAEAVDGATTIAESLRLSNSALGGKLSGAGTGTETVRDLADSKDRLVYTVDSDGNRSAVTRDLA